MENNKHINTSDKEFAYYFKFKLFYEQIDLSTKHRERAPMLMVT